MKFEPMISIIIPVYNGKKYLRQAIESALNQTYKNKEIIIVNDGSNDNGETDTIINDYRDKIRYIKKENGGVSSALNMGISNMKGQYFSWLSHDDVYLENKLEYQVEFLSNVNNKKTILYSNFEIIDKYSNFIRYQNPYLKHNIKLLEHNIYPLINEIIHGCSLLIAKDLFDDIPFNESLLTVQDYWAWFDLFRKAPLRYIDKILIQSRIHDEQGAKIHVDISKKEQTILWDKLIGDMHISELNTILKILKKEPIIFEKDITIRYLPKVKLEEIELINRNIRFTVKDLEVIFSKFPHYNNV